MTESSAKGIALAGGGPLGAIYEIGTLVALQEALQGFDFTQCAAYVGVSSGSFLAAGMANGLSPQAMHRMFIDSETSDDPFDPAILVRPAGTEFRNRLCAVLPLLATALQRYFSPGGEHGFFEAFSWLGRALPTGLFDNSGIDRILGHIFSAHGRTNDFRRLRHKLFLVATDLDSGETAPFGAPGWDEVPISRAVQASAALPGLFPPVGIDGRWYVDGALRRTVHASLALQAGVKLLICINPLVPFDADLAAERGGGPRIALVDGGLPQVLSQTFRALIHSRMEVGMARYRHEYPDADVVLFEPDRADYALFSANVFSYADRQQLCEHAYRHTRAELRRRQKELAPLLARHGVSLDHAVLDDSSRTILRHHRRRARASFADTAARLDRTLDRLDRTLGQDPAGTAT